MAGARPLIDRLAPWIAEGKANSAVFRAVDPLNEAARQSERITLGATRTAALNSGRRPDRPETKRQSAAQEARSQRD